jgi:hypothetical protein
MAMNTICIADLDSHRLVKRRILHRIGVGNSKSANSAILSIINRDLGWIAPPVEKTTGKNFKSTDLQSSACSLS